jgi:hypothetical protein
MIRILSKKINRENIIESPVNQFLNLCCLKVLVTIIKIKASKQYNPMMIGLKIPGASIPRPVTDSIFPVS